MLFAAYGAPSPPRGKNPLLIVLGVCGGCVVLVVIGVVIMGIMGANMFKGIIGGAIQSQETTRKFVTAIENHDYESAEAQIAPTARTAFSAAKIKAIEEQIEKKLGPIQPSAFAPASPSNKTIPGPNGKPKYMEYVYSIPVRYQKGPATIEVHFRSDDLSEMNDLRDISKIKIPGQVTSFKISADSE